MSLQLELNIDENECKNVLDYIPEKKKDRINCNLTEEQINFEYHSTHWGQRKLFLTELQFLSYCIYEKYKDKSKFLVIYAGAASGDHLPFLGSLFTHVEFHLYDPKEFNSQIYRNKKQFKINPIKDKHKDCGIFTDNIVETYKQMFKNYSSEGGGPSKYDDYVILFISDIRSEPTNLSNTGLIENDSKEQSQIDQNNSYDMRFEKIVYDDLDIQKKWILNLQPDESLLKFRTPFFLYKDIEYFRGRLFIQPWAPITTTETRMLISKDNLNSSFTYNCKLYERKMAYINIELRNKDLSELEANMVFDDNDHVRLGDIWRDKVKHISYDCYLETLIIYKYVKGIFGTVRTDEVNRYINLISKNLKKNKFNN